MRNFISDDGLFELTLPSILTYTSKSGNIYGFTFENDVGLFQLSVLLNHSNSADIKFQSNPKVRKRRFGNIIAYEMSLNSDLEFSLVNWLFKVGNISFLSTYTYPTKLRCSPFLLIEIKLIKKIISSVRVISPEKRSVKFAWYKFQKFLDGIAASNELLDRAEKNGSFIESVIIISNLIDAFLRIGIILHNQIESKNSEVDIELIYQGKKDKPIFEKEVYKIAKTKEIISEKNFSDLYKLYNARNKVVHRYIISNITTENIVNITINYYRLFVHIYEIISNLEKKQLKLGVGMIHSEIFSDIDIVRNQKETLLQSIKEKHGRINFDKFQN